MNPSLTRTMLFLAGSVRRPSMELLDLSVVPMRVWPSDLDVNLHMNNGRYLTLMDLGRFDLLVRTGMWRVMLDRGWRPMVGSAVVRFRRPLQLLSRFELHTRLACWGAKWFFIEQKFMREGSVCGVGFIKGLFRARSGNVAPAEVLAAMGKLQESPRVPPGIEEWVAAEDRLAGRADTRGCTSK